MQIQTELLLFKLQNIIIQLKVSKSVYFAEEDCLENFADWLLLWISQTQFLFLYEIASV